MRVPCFIDARVRPFCDFADDFIGSELTHLGQGIEHRQHPLRTWTTTAIASTEPGIVRLCVVHPSVLTEPPSPSNGISSKILRRQSTKSGYCILIAIESWTSAKWCSSNRSLAFQIPEVKRDGMDSHVFSQPTPGP